jgi:hypothetical protein
VISSAKVATSTVVTARSSATAHQLAIHLLAASNRLKKIKVRGLISLGLFFFRIFVEENE